MIFKLKYRKNPPFWGRDRKHLGELESDSLQNKCLVCKTQWIFPGKSVVVTNQQNQTI